MVKDFYKRLKKLQCLSPNSETNKLFCELYKYGIKDDKWLKVDSKVLEINEICAKAEFEMEKFWSKRILDSDNPNKELENFIYFGNYFKLTKLEFLNAKYFEGNINKVLFIGGGPFPLTAIFLAKYFGVNCKIVDYSKEAINLAKKLIIRLKLDKKITFEENDALYYKDEEYYDLVYVAGLVFGNYKQEEILENISKLNFSKILVRTSHRKRQILYKKVNEKILDKYFKKEIIVHPKNEVINSFIILSK